MGIFLLYYYYLPVYLHVKPLTKLNDFAQEVHSPYTAINMQGAI